MNHGGFLTTLSTIECFEYAKSHLCRRFTRKRNCHDLFRIVDDRQQFQVPLN